jgi:ribonucleoside-diphosphate reductase alpha chain
LKKIKYQGIVIDKEDPAYITEFSKTLLDGFYKREDETIPQALSRPATAFCYGDYELAQRIYDYAYKGWFMYASPVLSNATRGKWFEDHEKVGKHYWYTSTFVPEEKRRGLPISCFAFDVPDTAQGQVEAIQELATLSMSGGGTGAHLSIRGVGGKAVGNIPYQKVMDSAIGYFKQENRRGAIAAYLDVSHPDIVEHINFRKPGGDAKRRSDNRQQYHSAVNITDKFIDAVKDNTEYDLVCPHTGRVHDTLRAREVWENILETRALTGEPYLLKIDEANRRMPETQKAKGLKIRGSNLCSEIVLPTDENRTFVCCLSSLNLEKFEEWKDSNIVQDLVRFLDNVLQSFIDNAPDRLHKARFSAKSERALGLGTLGQHGYFQSKMIPIEGGGFNSSVQHTNMLFKLIKERATSESMKLATERGEPEDMVGTGLRNSRLMAVAPNSNSASLLDTSPSIEPYFRNIFLQSTRAGNFVVKNRHLEALLKSKDQDTAEVWKSIQDNEGRVGHLEFLSELEKKVFATAMEIDMHWLIELGEHRGKYVCQTCSLNLFFPFGSSRKYMNSVHMKYLDSKNVLTLYYLRTEREGDVDNARKIERVALTDWKGDECASCQG